MNIFLLSCISTALADSFPLEFERGISSKLHGHNAKFHELAKSNANHTFKEPLAADFYSYYTTITAGYPFRSYMVMLDTGIRDSWINGNDTFSSGLESLRSPWKIHHSGYDAEGEMAGYYLNLAGLEAQTVISVASTSNTMHNVLGLGLGAHKDNPYKGGLYSHANNRNLSRVIKDSNSTDTSSSDDLYGSDDDDYGDDYDDDEDYGDDYGDEDGDEDDNYGTDGDDNDGYSGSVTDSGDPDSADDTGSSATNFWLSLGGNKPLWLQSFSEAGKISAAAYSLYSTGSNFQGGQLLIGGVDHAKYSGTLGMVPLVKTERYAKNGTYTSFDVMMNGVSLVSGDHSCPLVTGFTIGATFATGSTYTILPSSIVTPLADAYDYSWDESSGYYIGSCTEFDFDSVELDFSGVKLNASAQSLLGPAHDGKCFLGIQPSDDMSDFVIGDNFLRHFYLAYHMDNQNLGLAPTRFTNESDIEDIGSDIPGATSAPSYSSTLRVNGSTSTHDVHSCQTKTTTAAMPSFLTDEDYMYSTYWNGMRYDDMSSDASSGATATASDETGKSRQTGSSSQTGSSRQTSSTSQTGSSSTHKSSRNAAGKKTIPSLFALSMMLLL